MTMQNLWRPLGLCALAATLWIGAPVQANADVSGNAPGVMLVARNDQQYNDGQGMNAPAPHKKNPKGLKAAKAPKAPKAGHNVKPAPQKAAKGSAYGQHAGAKNGKAPQVGHPGNKGPRNDQMAGPNGKQPKGPKVARPNDKRPGSRPDAQHRAPQRAPQRGDGEVTN
ncbi:hypothetical protein [Desulfovibrio sp. MES5]|uniref:hypothetical protein n=1 Tax=Desulfovibrio sp. MES5 TaxID=1899016 RepID=UPI0025C6B6BB|nr:hypothetical protein [Desulfovibrio sp. MES5]